MSDVTETIARWIGALLFVAAALGAAGLSLYQWGRTTGRSDEREVWQERFRVAERAARHTEADLAGIAAASAKRIALKEAALNEQARAQNLAWRALLARLPACRLPRAVGVQLDAASGVPAVAPVAEPSEPGADGAALDRTIELAETLDRVRENYGICQTNAARLTEARDWYNNLRERVNSGAQP